MRTVQVAVFAGACCLAGSTAFLAPPTYHGRQSPWGYEHHRMGMTSTASSKKISLTDQGLPRLLQWAKDEAGIKSPKVEVTSVDSLRGVVATQSISANEEIVVVPSASALVTTTDQQCPFPEWVDATYWDKSPWQVRLGLLLLKEKEKGTDSLLHHWIACLPKAFGTPLEWSDEDLSSLQYPYLEGKVKEQREEWSNHYKNLQSSSPACHVSEKDLNWASGVCYSRAVSGPYEGRGPSERMVEVGFLGVLAAGSLALGFGSVDQVANGALAVLVGIPLRDFMMTKLAKLKRYSLTPLVDMINHCTGVESDISYNYFYDYFGVTTKNGWDSGEEVFISYGLRSNDHLLQRYGFVERTNPNDIYEVVGLVDKLATVLGEEGVAVLRGSGGLLGNVESVTLTRQGVVEEEEARVLPALRLVALQDDQVPKGRADQIAITDFLNQVSSENEIAAKEALIKVCSFELDSKGTSLKDDESLLALQKKPMGGNRKNRDMALEFRIEKKHILKEAIASITEAVARDRAVQSAA